MFLGKSILTLGFLGASAIGFASQSASADVYYQQAACVPAQASIVYTPTQAAYIPRAPAYTTTYIIAPAPVYIPAPAACPSPVLVAPRPIFYPQQQARFDRHDWDRHDDHHDHDARFDRRDHR